MKGLDRIWRKGEALFRPGRKAPGVEREPERARQKPLETVPEPDRGMGTYPRSFSGTLGFPAGGEQAFVEYPYADPLALFPLLRYLRDAIPDVSAGVWAWVRLCSTPQRVCFTEGDKQEVEKARNLVRALDERIFEFEHMQRQGMDALVSAFFLSVFTYGAFAGEVVLQKDRRGIEKFYMIDPATVRFKRGKKSRTLIPYQLLQDGEAIRLSPASFFYYALDSDTDHPYGRSPLLSLPFVIRIQQQILADMSRSTHHVGWPTLHVKYEAPKRDEGESQRSYQSRIRANYRAIQENMATREPDSHFITFDNVDIKYLSPGGQSQKWSESLHAITEQVISGLHLAPFMIGRNWGTTQSWGLAQYELMVSNAVSVQRGAKRMCEWVRNLELILAGSRIRSEHHFRSHFRPNDMESARALESRVKAWLQLYEAGVLDQETVREKLDTI